MKEKDIQRINELARKSKTQGLTEAEKAEQKKLRMEFVADVKANLRSQLNNISIVEKDGSITDLGETVGKKKPVRLEEIE
ncbi:MAG: DUF896 domain-containing protein [Lachnospiraceae bacterium]|nr:DUF896 domain-containing protein [Lachnospiraceae bacterium]